MSHHFDNFLLDLCIQTILVILVTTPFLLTNKRAVFWGPLAGITIDADHVWRAIITYKNNESLGDFINSGARTPIHSVLFALILAFIVYRLTKTPEFCFAIFSAICTHVFWDGLTGNRFIFFPYVTHGVYRTLPSFCLAYTLLILLNLSFIFRSKRTTTLLT